MGTAGPAGHSAGRKKISFGAGMCLSRKPKKEMEIAMQKKVLIGLVLLGAIVLVALNATTAKVSFDVFSLKWTMKTVYALLASAVAGIVVGVMVRS